MEQANSAPGSAGRPVRLLVVDADPAATSSLEEWLAAHPEVELERRWSARETLSAMPCEHYDLCLIDEDGGDVDGVTLGAMILQMNPRSRVVLMTGRVTSPLRQRALEHGFRGVLAKPVVPAVLSMLVEPMRA